MVKMYKLLLIFASILLTVHTKHEEFDGSSLYTVKVQNLRQVNVFHNIIEHFLLDVWIYPGLDREGLVLVRRDFKKVFETELYNAGIWFEVRVQNIKDSLDLEDKVLTKAAATSQSNNVSLSFDTIHRYEVVDQYLVDLARQYPDLVKVVIGGKSYEGRDIKYLKISTTNFEDESKPIIIIQSLLHAREWVTLPASLYAIKKLVIDVTDKDLVENIDWIILPIANPDGYEFSHTNNRFWRKNRSFSLIPGNNCFGVDLNRNFDFYWGTISSDSPCSDGFHGLGPFSEPETQIIRDILVAHRHRLEAFLDMHSFGSMILFGFATGPLAPNALTLAVVAVRMAQAIDEVKWPAHRNYIVGTIPGIFSGWASGLAADYAQNYHARLAYTFELPAYRNIDSNLNGFLVQPEFIEQAGYETWEGVKAGARWILSNRRNVKDNKQ